MKSKTLLTVFIATVLFFYSCGGEGNRQQTTSENETTTVEIVEIVPTDPVIIDIVGNLENKREFRLSDFGSSVRYIRLQPPQGVIFSGTGSVSSNDDFLFVNTREGLFMYSIDGKYLHTFVLNEWRDAGIPAPGGGAGFRQVYGVLGNIDLLNGTLLYRTFQSFSRDDEAVQLNIFDVENLSENPNLQPFFQRELNPDRYMRGGTRYLLIDNEFFLAANPSRISPFFTAISIQSGDTLFTINNYHQPTITARAIPTVFSRFYRINGNLMLQIAHNDTVFTLIPPNQVEPAFIMEWGEFRSDMNRRANGLPQNDRFLLQNWIETQQHIFIEYTKGDGRGAPRHRAIFDKETKTLTHHTIPTMMFENDIDPVGMPFFPQGINHRGEMYMVFSKEQVQQQIATGKFNNSRLQALYNRMPDGSFYLMIVK